MKKQLIIVLCFALLFSLMFCSCENKSSNRKTSKNTGTSNTDTSEILNELYDLENTIQSRSELIIDSWNSEKLFYIKSDEKLDPFDIGKIASKTDLDEEKIRTLLSAKYTLDGECDLDSEHRCVVLFENEVYINYINEGDRTLDLLESKSLYLGYDTTEIKKMKESYVPTMYNFFMIKMLFDELNCKSEISSSLNALKTKVNNALKDGSISQGLYDKYTKAIDDLQKLDNLNYTILDFCTNMDNASEVYASKEEYKADVDSTISGISNTVNQIENLS